MPQRDPDSRPSSLSGELAHPRRRPRAGARPSALLVAFFAGCVFAVGLILSGMTQPEKVIAFLDVKEMFIGEFPGEWDPTLMFVVLGAVLIALLGFTLTLYASKKPWFTSSFELSTRRHIDGRLIAGAVVFGIGWGLGGYSPAAALASLLTGQIDTVVFVLAMLPGMWLAGKM